MRRVTVMEEGRRKGWRVRDGGAETEVHVLCSLDARRQDKWADSIEYIRRGALPVLYSRLAAPALPALFTPVITRPSHSACRVQLPNLVRGLGQPQIDQSRAGSRRASLTRKGGTLSLVPQPTLNFYGGVYDPSMEGGGVVACAHVHEKW